MVTDGPFPEEQNPAGAKKTGASNDTILHGPDRRNDIQMTFKFADRFCTIPFNN
jgi:hypothetical protein